MILFLMLSFADDSTPYPMCNWTCDLFEQLEFASELESDMRHYGLVLEVIC